MPCFLLTGQAILWVIPARRYHPEARYTSVCIPVLEGIPLDIDVVGGDGVVNFLEVCLSV